MSNQHDAKATKEFIVHRSYFAKEFKTPSSVVWTLNSTFVGQEDFSLKHPVWLGQTGQTEARRQTAPFNMNASVFSFFRFLKGLSKDSSIH